MRWDKVITLIAVEVIGTDAQGYPIQGKETATKVYGALRSVGFNEFYQAQLAGVDTEIKAVMRTIDYDGQRIAEIDGKRYQVLRSYIDAQGEYTELTLSRLRHKGRSSR